MRVKWPKYAGLAAAVVLTAAVGGELLGLGKEPPLKPEERQIAGKDLKGKAWSLRDHLGRRPVVVSFFATWCSPCREEVPQLVEMESKFRNRGLQVVLLSEEDEKTLRENHLQNAPIPVLANMTRTFTQFKVDGIPRTLYFNKSGKLAADLSGYDAGGLKKISGELEKLPALSASAASP